MQAAFLSYVHNDHQNSDEQLLKLIAQVQKELRLRLGSDEFQIYIDRQQIKLGQAWRTCIDQGVAETTVLLPVISPAYLKHQECIREYDLFVAKEKLILARPGWKPENRLVLPLVLRDVLPDQVEDPIWQDCETIIFEHIESLTEPHLQVSRNKLVTKFAKKLASRIVKLKTLLDESREDEDRFSQDNGEDPIFKLLADFSKPLRSWRKTIGESDWIPRDELATLKDAIATESSSTRFLIGGPGTGKSALLSRLLADLEDDGNVVLGIKADALPLGIDSIAALSQLILGDEANDDVSRELIRLAAYQKVVVVIDQLDALGDLADLNSGRLNAVLDLIAQLRDNDGIHVVASVRRFELNSDERLKGLVSDGDEQNKEVVNLPSFSPEQVVETLKSFGGIDTTHWPEGYLEFLAVPYHLAIFTDNIGQFVPTAGQVPDAALFSSIQAIHQKNFALSIEASENHQSLETAILELVGKVEATESLWQPLSEMSGEFQGMLAELDDLGWAVHQGDQVAFAHQTQYEYLSVRRFVKKPSDFVSHVLEREDGLFVRPTVWHGLAQIRALHPDNYSIAISGLLAKVSRRHLKRLLMEFLSEVSQPTASEIKWVTGFLLNQQTSASMCWLLRGKQDWFNEITDEVFAELMKRPPDNAWPAARLLAVSWELNPERTIELLRQHWAFRSEYATHLMFVFEDSKDFDEEQYSWLLFTTDESPDYSWWASRFLAKLADVYPRQAYGLLLTMLTRQLDTDCERLRNETVAPNGMVDEEKFANERHNLVTRDFPGDRWYVLREVWEADPQSFVSTVWPWFLKVMTFVQKERRYVMRVFQSGEGMLNWFAEDGLSGVDLITVLSKSLKHWANTQPQSFIAFTIKNWRLDCMTVQRLLAQGVTELAAKHPGFALAFLKQDPRRLFLGGVDLREDTLELIRTAMPVWSKKQCDEFQELILEFPVFDENDGADKQQSAEQFRARFLWEVPQQLLLGPSRLLIEKHQETVNEDASRRKERRGRCLEKETATLSAPEMEKLTATELPQQLSEILSGLGDVRANHAAFLTTEEFKTFSEKHPKRSLSLMEQLKPDHEKQKLVAAGIVGLVKSVMSNASVLALIRKLEADGFNTLDYRNTIADAIRQIAIDEEGLPTDLCEMLGRWLLETPFPEVLPELHPRSIDKQAAAYDPSSAVSVLWLRSSRMYFLPGQWFQIGEALKLGYCLGDSAQPEKWLAAMQLLIKLERPFSSSVWNAWLSGILRYDPCEAKAAELVVAILDAHQDVLESDIGAAALAMYGHLMAPEHKNRFLDHLCSQSGKVLQGGGEVAAWLWLRNDDQEAFEIVEQKLSLAMAGNDASQAFLIGVCTTASHHWENEDYQSEAVDLLVRLAAVPNANVHRIVFHCFLNDRPLVDSSNTKRLLEACIAHIDFQNRDSYWLVKHLRQYVRLNPELTSKLMRCFINGLMNRGATETQQISFYEDIVAGIVLTLHRQTEPLRSDALTMYEDLLDLKVTGAADRLRDLDCRPNRS